MIAEKIENPPGLGNADLLTLLAVRYPSTFFLAGKDRRPLKLGIHHDLLALTPRPVGRKKLSEFLAWYTNRFDYLVALRAGATRLDLAGEPVGNVTADEELDAIRGFVEHEARWRTRWDEARKAQQPREQHKPKVPVVKRERVPQASSLTSSTRRDGLADLRAAARARRAP